MNIIFIPFSLAGSLGGPCVDSDVLSPLSDGPSESLSPSGNRDTTCYVHLFVYVHVTRAGRARGDVQQYYNARNSTKTHRDTTASGIQNWTLSSWTGTRFISAHLSVVIKRIHDYLGARRPSGEADCPQNWFQSGVIRIVGRKVI